MKIIIVGPSHPYRGGIAAFTDRLANEFLTEGADVELYVHVAISVDIVSRKDTVFRCTSS